MQSARVGDIAEQVRGVTYAKNEAAGTPAAGLVPLLRAGNITDRGVHFDDLIYVPRIRVSPRQTLQAGDVLIAASSGSLDVVGKAARLAETIDATFGAFCKVLRPSKEVDSRYFAHYFQTPTYRGLISSLAAGVNINNLRNEHLNDLRVPLPPIDEQRRIADILDRANALRARRREVLNLLDDLTQSIFLDMFGQLESTVEFGSIITSGPTNGLYRPLSDYGSGTPILRIDGFDSGEVKPGEWKRLQISLSELQRYSLDEGDIVINRVNALSHLGKSALIEQLDERAVFESNMMRIRLDRDQAEPRYVIAWLQTPSAKHQILSRAKKSINQASINQSDVRSLSMPWAPHTRQVEFAQRIQRVLAQRDAVRRGLVGDGELFASLQHQAFSGQL